MPAKEDCKAVGARVGPWLAGPTAAGAWQWYQHAGAHRSAQREKWILFHSLRAKRMVQRIVRLSKKSLSFATALINKHFFCML
jgi:hypothetical protein